MNSFQKNTSPETTGLPGLRSLRNSQNLTVPALARDVNCSEGFLYKLEHGKVDASRDMLERLADYFNCSTDQLLGRTPPASEVA